MKASYVQRGDYIDIVPETDVSAGDIVVRGRLVGVSKLDIKAGTLGAVATSGVYDVAKGGDAFAAGDKVYWSEAEGKAATEGGTLLGLCVQDAEDTSPTVRVILRSGAGNAGQTPGEAQGAPSAAIGDLALQSVTEGGAWSGGDANANLVADLTGIRDKVNAILAALRARGILEDE
ncbi:MAG: DUF2190 family protein [Oligosphaeraceae bacterium]